MSTDKVDFIKMLEEGSIYRSEDLQEFLNYVSEHYPEAMQINSPEDEKTVQEFTDRLRKAETEAAQRAIVNDWKKWVFARTPNGNFYVNHPEKLLQILSDVMQVQQGGGE